MERTVGTLVGLLVGTSVGLFVGLLVGTSVGLSVGLVVGASVGLLVGLKLGTADGLVELVELTIHSAVGPEVPSRTLNNVRVRLITGSTRFSLVVVAGFTARTSPMGIFMVAASSSSSNETV